MYNLWYFTIVFVVVTFVGIILWIIGSKSWSFGLEGLGMGLSLVGFVIFVMLLCLSIVLPLQAKQEYKEFVENQSMIEQIYEESNVNENIGLTQKVVELNQWLAKAKTSKDLYGNWSMYCNLNLEDLEYIKLKGV